MQQPANAVVRSSSSVVPAVNMANLVRQPSSREIQVQSDANGQFGEKTSMRLQMNSKPNDVAQNTSYSPRVTTLILPSRSTSHVQNLAQRPATASQKQNLVTVTRVHSAPSVPGSTQILYNANLAALNLAPVYSGTQVIESSPQLIAAPSSVKRLSNRSYTVGSSVTHQSPAILINESAESRSDASRSSPIAIPCDTSKSVSESSSLDHHQGVANLIEISSEESIATSVCGVKERVTASQDDALTNLNWLQNPNLMSLARSNSPPPPLSPPPTSPLTLTPTSSSTSAFRFGAASDYAAIGGLSTPPRSASGGSQTQSQLASPIASPNMAHFARFASQQIAALAPFDAEDADEQQLARIAGELERRDTPFAIPFPTPAPTPVFTSSSSDSNTCLFPSAVNQQAVGAYAAKCTPTGYRMSVNGTGASRFTRQRSAPYNNAPRRANARPRSRAARRSQQNAAPPTINPRLALAAGYRMPRGLGNDPLLSATGVNSNLAAGNGSLISSLQQQQQQQCGPVHRGGSLPVSFDAQFAGAGQVDMMNPLNEAELADFLRAFENESNMEMVENSDLAASPDLDLTVHGVGLKAADLACLGAADSFDRIFGLCSASPNFAGPVNTSQCQSVLGLNAHLAAPMAMRGCGSNLPLGMQAGSYADASAVIDLMNPTEICFNDERAAEQCDSDFLESLDEFALDSILGSNASS